MRPDPERLALRVLEDLRAHRFAAVRHRFASAPRRRLKVSALASAWAQHVERYGDLVEAEVVSIEQETGPAGAGCDVVRISLSMTRMPLDLAVTTDVNGRLLDIQVTPSASAWLPPSYADPDSFEEEEVVLQTDVGPLHGSVVLPVVPATRRAPGILLLAGGGPFDRDMTVGPNRIGKDLAWGLASRGIAVLRVDKPTSARAVAPPTREYLAIGGAGVAALRAQDRVDANRVHLLGHSMGGRMAPLVAAHVPGVAGIVYLAADAVPLERAAVRVARHLATLPDAPPAAAAFARRIERRSRLLASDRFSPRTRPDRLPFGYPPSWWADVRSYDPVATAVGLDLPMLFLQGGRDYQVTAHDDLQEWQAALGRRADVTTHLLPQDDHLFFPGTGPSTPAGYDAPQHVDPAVVDVIATWLRP